MEEIRHILLIIRMIENSGEILHDAIGLAKRFGAELSVLRPIPNEVELGAAVNAPGLFFKGEEYKNYLSRREQYKEELDQAIRQVTRGGFQVKEYVTWDDPVKEAVRLVKEEKIDLIVVPAHEEGRLEHMLFGGENDTLMRRLPCSMLLVKHEPGPVRWEEPE
ncbi:universal stress protein [Geotalea toluenoxydans]|uniref:universal stress protein n=1 Tax=Geotalea toluenoxydans TaxID=421624 RepID=UPI0006D1ED6A|nr:universal stress protein [Geotalea toluenoxydans]